MNVDDIDFVRRLWVWDFKSNRALVSSDECKFLGATWYDMMEESGESPAKEYGRKLELYYNRFQNHMPIPLRKQLLQELEHV